MQNLVNRILILLVLMGFCQFFYGQNQSYADEFYKIDSAKLYETLEKTIDSYQNFLPVHPLTIEDFSLINKKKTFVEIFYNNSPIYQFPDRESNVLEILNFRDSVYTPQFKYYPENYSVLFIIDPTIGSEISHPDFYLCITKSGRIGFIHSNNMIYKEIQQDGIFTLFYGGYGKTALANQDKSKIKYFDSYNVNKLFNHNIYIYSVINDFYSIQITPIYLFDTDTWEEEFITNGNNPIFFNDSLVVFYQYEHPSNVDSQVISLYNLKTASINKIFSPPEGYSMVFRGDDGGELSQLIISDDGSTITFYINEINDSEYFDVPTYMYTINEKGELLFSERR